MLPGGVRIESASGFWEFEAHSFPDDSRLISRLKSAGSAFILEQSGPNSRDPRPLFSKGPEWSEDYATEGSIGMEWKATCFLPTDLDSAERKQLFSKHEIDITADFSGNSLYSYTIKYTYETPEDILESLISALEEESVSARLEKPILRILGLIKDDGL